MKQSPQAQIREMHLMRGVPLEAVATELGLTMDEANAYVRELREEIYELHGEAGPAAAEASSLTTLGQRAYRMAVNEKDPKNQKLLLQVASASFFRAGQLKRPH